MLVLEEVSAAYDGVQVLYDISLRLEQGEIVCVIGANGAGKTTILRTISGLLAPIAGRIWFENTRIDRLPPHAIARRGIAHVPEGRRIFDQLTVEENLRMGAFLLQDWHQVREAFDHVYQIFPILFQRRGQRAGTLSGGEQQMLAIARGLMSNPKLLLLDEPSLGLAPKVIDMLFEVILNLNRLGRTILLVEQNASRALEIAHRAYVLEVGRVTLSGPARELQENEYVRRAYLGM
ncbi:MAG: ABC transporter ATP-binding protein [Armatimonadota bacterium]|nr:ABC transporter ATP-binding protein [Armatimonadota bacterium]